MKNFILNYLLKYIFILCFFLILGQLIKSFNMDLIKALGLACGTILYDIITFLYKKMNKAKISS